MDVAPDLPQPGAYCSADAQCLSGYCRVGHCCEYFSDDPATDIDQCSDCSGSFEKYQTPYTIERTGECVACDAGLYYTSYFNFSLVDACTSNSNFLFWVASFCLHYMLSSFSFVFFPRLLSRFFFFYLLRRRLFSDLIFFWLPFFFA